MIVKRRQKTDANLAEVVEIPIGNVASRPVVFDQISVILVIRSGKLGIRAQVVRRSGVRFKRAWSGAAGRIGAARTGARGLRCRGAGQQSRDHNYECTMHATTPLAFPAGTWQWLQSR